MHHFYLLLLILSSTSSRCIFQEKSLEGKYLMKYEQEYKAQDCIIKFKKDSYVRKLNNGKKVFGVVKYEDFKVLLNDKETPLQMILIRNTIQSDTIKFRTIDRNNKAKPTGDIVFLEGKLIRVK